MDLTLNDVQIKSLKTLSDTPSVDTRNASCRTKIVQNSIPTPLLNTLTPLNSMTLFHAVPFLFLLHARCFKACTWKSEKEEGKKGRETLKHQSMKHSRVKLCCETLVPSIGVIKKMKKGKNIESLNKQKTSQCKQIERKDFFTSTFFRVSTVAHRTYFFLLFVWNLKSNDLIWKIE